jgi:hypothetical protein
MMFTGMGDSFATIENEAATEIGPLRMSENVTISDGAPSIDSGARFRLSCNHHLIPIEGLFGSALAFRGFPGPQYGPAWIRAALQAEVEGHLDWMLQQFGFGDDIQIVGRCLASVLDDNPYGNGNAIFGAVYINSTGSRDNVSAQLAHGCTFGSHNKATGFVDVVFCRLGALPQRLDLLGYLLVLGAPVKICRLGFGLGMPKLTLASYPEPSSGKPESDGGNGENYRESTDNTFVVSFKESVARINRGDYSRVKGGAIFWFIVIGGLCTVLWLYQAQR